MDGSDAQLTTAPRRFWHRRSEGNGDIGKPRWHCAPYTASMAVMLPVSRLQLQHHVVLKVRVQGSLTTTRLDYVHMIIINQTRSAMMIYKLEATTINSYSEAVEQSSSRMRVLVVLAGLQPVELTYFG